MSAAPNLAKEAKSRRKTGLGYWMRRVLKEADKAVPDLSPDPVHDLRVALRRCRSMADGLRAVDPDKSWKKMKKLGKPVFQVLGELRDVQVMKEWNHRLGTAEDETTKTLCRHIENREAQLKQQALQALGRFDRPQWKTWCHELPRRAARIRVGSPVFKHLALERWMEARKLQPHALRTGSPQSLHRLRIGLKRFRYTVENFLPQLDGRWSDDLKEIQDLLGEVHDLDVLWDTALTIGAFSGETSRKWWHEAIAAERQKRVDKYREKMSGPQSLWNVWRDQLPEGREIQAAALSRLKAWASFLDPDFQHARRVAQLAARFYDDLTRKAIEPVNDHQDLRSILYAAALMHEVGRSRKQKDHHKRSSRLIRSLRPPLGWTREDLNLAGIIARYHRGALPQARHGAFGRLPVGQRRTALRLAAILRFVDAIERQSVGRALDHPGAHLQLTEKGRVLQVYAPGYRPYSDAAIRIAAARHLLEVNLRRPVLVKAVSAKKYPIRQNKTRRAKRAA